jgi:hypothetical protein
MRLNSVNIKPRRRFLHMRVNATKASTLERECPIASPMTTTSNNHYYQNERRAEHHIKRCHIASPPILTANHGGATIHSTTTMDTLITKRT